MSTGASQQGTGGTGSDEVNGVAPLADDRPYVDGTAVSAEELRAEVERLSNEEQQHVDDLREEVGDSVAELAARFDVKARVAERKEEAVATVHQNLDRARHVAADGVVTAKDTRPPRSRGWSPVPSQPCWCCSSSCCGAAAEVTPERGAYRLPRVSASLRGSRRRRNGEEAGEQRRDTRPRRRRAARDGAGRCG